MLVVGLTGGIASGKSLVSGILRDLGAHVIDADEVSREVMRPHTECWKSIVDNFGNEILRDNLTIDRKKLSDYIFNDSELRVILNRCVHPEITRRIKEMVGAIEESTPEAIVVVEAALLVETGAHTTFDKLIVVYASEGTQMQRLMKRDKITRSDAQKRIDSQLSVSEKVKSADYVITNEGDIHNTRNEVEVIFKELTSLSHTFGFSGKSQSEPKNT